MNFLFSGTGPTGDEKKRAAQRKARAERKPIDPYKEGDPLKPSELAAGRTDKPAMKAGDGPELEAQLRNPSARGRHRRAHDPDSSRASEPGDDGALYARLDPDGPGGGEPARFAALNHFGDTSNDTTETSPLLNRCWPACKLPWRGRASRSPTSFASTVPRTGKRMARP